MARKTLKRGVGGRFIKGGTKGAARSTAIVRQGARAPARAASPGRIVVIGQASPPAKRKSGGVSRGGGVGGPVHRDLVGSLKAKGPYLAAGAAYGFVMGASSGTAVKIREVVSKVPTIAAIGVPATHGILLAFISTKTKGKMSRAIDALGFAALMKASTNLGASSFDLTAAAKLSGADDGDMSGAIEDGDLAGDDDGMRGEGD